jgi:hypothetical protein
MTEIDSETSLSSAREAFSDQVEKTTVADDAATELAT